MKIRDIAKEYNLDQESFERYIHKVRVPIRNSLSGGMIFDGNVEELVQKYLDSLEQEKSERVSAIKKAVEESSRRAQAETEKQRALASMLITSGFNFDGYRIKKYSGYISGDDAISIDRGTDSIFSHAADVGSSLTASLVKIRRRAIQELKEAAYDLGCNAVIGVDFDYITLEPETANYHGGTTYLPYVFCVTANGNAVIIEKIEE